MDVARGEDRILSGKRQIGSGDKAKSDAGGGTLHRGDDRLRHMPQMDQQRVQTVDNPVERLPPLDGGQSDQLAEHRDVAAGAEMRPSAAQQHDSGRAILGGFGGGSGEFADQLAVGGVEHLRPVQHDLEDGLSPLHDNTVHRSAPCAVRRIMPRASRKRIP